MIEPKPPNMYLVRVDHGYRSHPHNIEARKVWAFSSEDAVFQVKTDLGQHSESRVQYVGPVNPNCQCAGGLERCVCGVAAR